MKKYLVDIVKFKAFMKKNKLEVVESDITSYIDITDHFALCVNKKIQSLNEVFINFSYGYDYEDETYMDESIPGVNILIQGSTSGTVTDIDGNYQLNVPAGATTLVFSYVGYKSQTVEIGTRNTINVALVADVTALSEIVVTGYGTQEKKEEQKRSRRRD